MKPIDLYYLTPYIIRYPVFAFSGAFQAQSRYGRKFHNFFHELMKNLAMSRDQIDSLQTERMKQLLLHAYEHVPYYKRAFKLIDFHPKDYRNESDLKNLPVLTKDIIKKNFKDLIADNFPLNKRILYHTGGTTGVPLRFYLPKQLKGPFSFATVYRFYNWAGVSYGDKRVTIAGRLITKNPPYSMRNPAEKQLYVCAHYLNKENLDRIAKSILRFKPSYVEGHPSAVAVLSQYLADKSIEIPVKSVFTTSENLYSDQRTIIEKTFKSKVFDIYGMGEEVAMGSECTEHNGYHLAPEYGITEIVNQNEYVGDFGELVSTSLQNFVMPLIRYKCGDLGKLGTGPCQCGCNFPMLDKIYGRTDDVIITSTGLQILPLTIRIQMRNAGFSDFQLIQESLLNYNLHFFSNPNPTEGEQIGNRARLILTQILGQGSFINVSFNCKPFKTISGKQQMIIKESKNMENIN